MIIITDKSSKEILYACTTQSVASRLTGVNYRYLRSKPKVDDTKTVKGYVFKWVTVHKK